MSSPFIMLPIIAPAVRRRPSAAVTTGEELWHCLAYSVIFLVAAQKALIVPFAAVALTIWSSVLNVISDPFRPLAKGLKKHLITDKEKDISSAPVLPIIRRMKSFCKARLGKAVSDHLARTVDLDTSAGVVYLANTDERQLIRDRDFLERIESRYFDMLFYGESQQTKPYPTDCKTIPEILDELKPVGSILLYSEEIRELEGVTTVDASALSDTEGGFAYAILDLPDKDRMDPESGADLFFDLVGKLRAGGRIVVPERTYRNFPCGAESIEILCEAAGLFIEAPRTGIGGIVVGCVM